MIIKVKKRMSYSLNPDESGKMGCRKVENSTLLYYDDLVSISLKTISQTRIQSGSP